MSRGKHPLKPAARPGSALTDLSYHAYPKQWNDFQQRLTKYQANKIDHLSAAMDDSLLKIQQTKSLNEFLTPGAKSANLRDLLVLTYFLTDPKLAADSNKELPEINKARAATSMAMYLRVRPVLEQLGQIADKFSLTSYAPLITKISKEGVKDNWLFYLDGVDLCNQELLQLAADGNIAAIKTSAEVENTVREFECLFFRSILIDNIKYQSHLIAYPSSMRHMLAKEFAKALTERPIRNY